MARDRLTFRQRDLKAALKAAKDAGLISPIARIEIGEDCIRIYPGAPAEAEPDPAPTNPGERRVAHAIIKTRLRRASRGKA